MPTTPRPAPCGHVARSAGHSPGVHWASDGPPATSAAELAKLGASDDVAGPLAEVSTLYRSLLEMLAPFSCGSSRRSHAANCTRTTACDHGRFDIVVLATYPRSGTGWTQSTYAAASGLRWETVYDLAGETNRTAYGTFEFLATPGARSRRDDEPAFVKSHFPDWGCPPPSFGPKTCIVARVVHLIRNPLDQIIAMYTGLTGETRLRRNLSFPLPESTKADWLRRAPAITRSFIRWHCRVAIAFRERPVLLLGYDDLIADPKREFTRLLSFVLGEKQRASALEQLGRILARPGAVRHVEATTPLRGAFPVYTTDRRFATAAAVGAIARELRESLALGVWANAIEADSAEGNETVLGPNAAAPLYPWKTGRKDMAQGPHGWPEKGGTPTKIVSVK